jgi:hypothetical protein
MMENQDVKVEQLESIFDELSFYLLCGLRMRKIILRRVANTSHSGVPSSVLSTEEGALIQEKCF